MNDKVHVEILSEHEAFDVLFPGYVRDVFGRTREVFIMSGLTMSLACLLVFLDVCFRKQSS